MVLLALCAASLAATPTRPAPPSAQPAFSDDERTALSAVRDGDSQLDEAGLYVMFGRAAALGGLQTRDYADVVPAGNLLADPDHYRGRLVALNVRLWRVTEWPANEVTPTRWWGRRPVWRLDCTERDTGTPLIVYLTGRPEAHPEGRLPNGPRAAVHGLFYKVVRLDKHRPQPGQDRRQDYPVIVADALQVAAASPPVGRKPYLMFALLGALVVAFLLAKRTAARRRREGMVRLRRTAHPPRADAGPVDEELVRQVQQYKAEHGQDENQ